METITVSTIVNAGIVDVWSYWNEPEHITKWAFASGDWECPHAENDARTGGSFKIVMAAKDGAASFDFTGTYVSVVPHERIDYTTDDGRNVHVTFAEEGDGKTRVVETFDPEKENPLEMQRIGWQSVLENFKTYAESVR
jgi:uncharacterized protein YndB with AHSA1/START domain